MVFEWQREVGPCRGIDVWTCAPAFLPAALIQRTRGTDAVLRTVAIATLSALPNRSLLPPVNLHKNPTRTSIRRGR